MGLFVNELCKIRSSKSVKGVIIVFLCFVALAGLIFGGGKSTSPVAVYGFGAPFIWLSANGASGFFLYAAIAAGMIAREFELGVVHNALGSGVKRGRYFITKVISVFGISVAIYLGCVVTLCIFKSWTAGFDPEGEIFPDYGWKVLLYSAGAIISILSYVAVFILIAYLLRNAVLTFIASVVLTLVEMLGGYKGPMMIAVETIEFIETDDILSWDFVNLFIPCIFILIISLAAAYVLFAVTDVD